jgi:hypothetical protein
LQFIDERIAEYEKKAMNMFESLVETTNEPDVPQPPALVVSQKQSDKKKSNAKGKSLLQRIMKFDLTEIPGIDYGTASIIVSELGSSFDCFPSEDHFASYLGLAPSLGKSAGKNVRHKKCKNTSRAGLALRIAAFTLSRSKSELGAYFRNVARRTDRKTAVKATARRIAHMIYRGVRYGKEYIDRGAEAYEIRLKEKVVKMVRKLIKSYGINSLELAI